MSSIFTPEVKEIVLAYMEALDCGRSLAIAIMLREGDWQGIFEMKTPVHHYEGPDAYYRAVSATSLLSKLNTRVKNVDPDEEARKKWLAAEKQCFVTNRRFGEILDFGTLNGEPVPSAVHEFLVRMRKAFSWLLGERPPEEIEGRFGPGATISDAAERTTVPHKCSSVPTITASASHFLIPWVGTKWGAAVASRGDEIVFERGNRFFTAPKKATESRPCAKSPSLNAFYQLGVGKIMRRRLNRHKLLESTSQDTHRRVACVGSSTDDLVTIDLSSASDTVATALVELVAPPLWFELLDDLREKVTYVPGHSNSSVAKGTYVLEKFSAMGNGFTFELETAIFASIVTACDETLIPGHDFWVYGDDIIVPKRVSEDVIAALRFCGFTPNESKTFTTGPFRESCGGDFYLGCNVRGHYMKELPIEPQDYIGLANGMRRVIENARRIERDWGPIKTGSKMSRTLLRAWFRTLDCLPSAVRRCRGPIELGDLVITDDEKHWSIRWRGQTRYVRCYRPVRPNSVRFDRFCGDVQYAAALYGVSPLSPLKPRRGWPEFFDSRRIPMRGDVEGYKVGWLPYS